MRFSDMIYNKLIEKNMSQRQLALKVGITPPEISRLLSHKRIPKTTTFFAICRVLDLDINEAFEGLKEDI